jgi:phage terminase large subunit
MAYTSKKLSAVLCVDEVKECFLGSESEEIISDSEFDSENEWNYCAFLDVVVDDNSDDDDGDCYSKPFTWEDMDSYKGQRENFMGSAGSQGAAAEVDSFEFLAVN